MSVKSEIIRLKEEKNALILAHYYVNDDVQEIADCVGDSYYLSKKAADTEADIIVFCGVRFMAESAKILNPSKKVLMPDDRADCAMAHMATVRKIQQMKSAYEDLSVVCYINSTTEIKMHSDVCVTSSNAVKIVRKISSRNIFFVPDRNLGRYVAEQVPDKNIILNDGYCPVHDQIQIEDVKRAKGEHPGAEFLAHPECTMEVLREADYVGSTSGIIDRTDASSAEEFIIGTETGVLYAMQKRNPDKRFYPVRQGQICGDMKLVTLDKVLDVLRHETNEVVVSDEVRSKAMKPIERMLEMGR